MHWRSSCYYGSYYHVEADEGIVTDEMRNISVDAKEYTKGPVDALPVDSGSVDYVISQFTFSAGHTDGGCRDRHEFSAGARTALAVL
jgi:hypothetical protein